MLVLNFLWGMPVLITGWIISSGSMTRNKHLLIYQTKSQCILPSIHVFNQFPSRLYWYLDERQITRVCVAQTVIMHFTPEGWLRFYGMPSFHLPCTKSLTWCIFSPWSTLTRDELLIGGEAIFHRYSADQMWWRMLGPPGVEWNELRRMYLCLTWVVFRAHGLCTVEPPSKPSTLPCHVIMTFIKSAFIPLFLHLLFVSLLSFCLYYVRLSICLNSMFGWSASLPFYTLLVNSLFSSSPINHSILLFQSASLSLSLISRSPFANVIHSML